jgi:hypothetical protein
VAARSSREAIWWSGAVRAVGLGVREDVPDRDDEGVLDRDEGHRGEPDRTFDVGVWPAVDISDSGISRFFYAAVTGY